MPIPLQTPLMPGEDQPIPAELNLRCAHCGYLLTGLITRVCPECGEAFDPLETFQANIKSTWEFHFEYFRPRWQYILLGAATALALIGFALVAIVFGPWVYGSPRWFLPAAFVSVFILAQCYLHDKRGPFVWLVLVYVFLGSAVLTGLIP
jgi:hypothetical protein